MVFRSYKRKGDFASQLFLKHLAIKLQNQAPFLKLCKSIVYWVRNIKTSLIKS